MNKTTAFAELAARINSHFDFLQQEIQNSALSVPEETIASADITKWEVGEKFVLFNPDTENFLTHSLYTGCYAFFEYAFKKVCMMHAMYDGNSRVFYFEKLPQYFSYIINAVPGERDLMLEQWNQLMLYREIRNLIVHHHMEIGEYTSAELIKFISENSSLTMKESSFEAVK
ncbi:MAG: hypothetical protein ACK40G_17680 [Cytophagaceae bacterium]